jgi:hypothetical protein
MSALCHLVVRPNNIGFFKICAKLMWMFNFSAYNKWDRHIVPAFITTPVIITCKLKPGSDAIRWILFPNSMFKRQEYRSGTFSIIRSDTKQNHFYNWKSLLWAMEHCFQARGKAGFVSWKLLCILFYLEGSWGFALQSHFVHGKRINVVYITQGLGNVLWVISGMGKVQHSLEPNVPIIEPI